MENLGWVKLHRKILDNPCLNKDKDIFYLWIYLLLNATHKSIEGRFKNERIKLKPGQIITGRIKLSRETLINESKIERIIKKLKSEQQIEQQTSNKERLITVLNWEQYQGEGTREGTTSEQQVNNKGTHNKNANNEKNKNKPKKIKTYNKLKEFIFDNERLNNNSNLNDDRKKIIDTIERFFDLGAEVKENEKDVLNFFTRFYMLAKEKQILTQESNINFVKLNSLSFDWYTRHKDKGKNPSNLKNSFANWINKSLGLNK